MRVLITGGAGFVGANLAVAFRAEAAAHEVVAFDNLRRRGAETNLSRLKQAGVHFVHGDVRTPGCTLMIFPGTFDLLIEASAEPSVHAGLHGSPTYVLDTNLGGMLHSCLEFTRRRCAAMLFLSTSRVYSIGPLRSLCLTDGATRLAPAVDQPYPGVSAAGISEAFPVHLPRSFYGASKLCAEYVLQEYVSSYGVKAVINRCGVIAGPGQFGRVDQGVFTLWVAHHYFGRPLRYTGFGGTGKQVRDLWTPRDLYALIQRQLTGVARWEGETYNVGGGPQGAVSLQEFTALCQAAVGRVVPVGRASRRRVRSTSRGMCRIAAGCRWRVAGSRALALRRFVRRIVEWIRDNAATVQELIG